MVVSSFLELVVVSERTERILDLAHATRALLNGDFTLASGKKSNHYFEGKRLTLHPEGADLIGREVLDRLAETEVEAIGGLAMGAFPIVTATAVISYQEGKAIPTFIVREEPKEHGTKRQIEGHFTAGSKVAIVDDVITTGGSVLKAIKTVEAANCQVVKVIVIVDRHEGGSDELKNEGYDFTAIIDLWPSGEASVGDTPGTSGEVRAGLIHQ